MIMGICSAISDSSDREFMIWLYQSYENTMFVTAKRYVHEQYACEVVVQDSIIKLIEKIPSLKQYDSAHLAGYIVLTVKHTAIDHLRRINKEKNVWAELEEEVETTSAEERTTERIFITVENRKALAQVWGKIPKKDRFLLEGKYILGYSDRELAELFGCKSQSIRMKLTRARRNAVNLMRGEGII